MIGKTNAVIGGCTSDYDLWQQGFGVDWDNIINNTPSIYTNKVLQIYPKIDFIKRITTNYSNTEYFTYNVTTGLRRQVYMDAKNRINFDETDVFVNTYDGLEYIALVFCIEDVHNNPQFRIISPVVYHNSRNLINDYVNNLVGDGINNKPIIRGIDCNTIGSGSWQRTINIPSTLQHLSFNTIGDLPNDNLELYMIHGNDEQVKIVKQIYDKLPPNNTFFSSVGAVDVRISDGKLADWFYNKFLYDSFNYNNRNNYYFFARPISSNNYPLNVCYKFKINESIIFYNPHSSHRYLRQMPNCIWLEGLITEDQTKAGDPTYGMWVGLHGFSNSGWKLLHNFPMWKVLEGATTGCLLPMVNQTHVSFYTYGSFRFYSKLLNPKYFCEFDENGIIEDPTKYFICNLPVQNISHANIYVRFEDLTFKDNYTASQQDAIRTYLANKNWNLVW